MAANKFLMFVVAIMFLVSLVAAFEFDNVANYESETFTLKVNNCNLWVGTCLIDGDLITEMKLTTENIKIRDNKPNVVLGTGDNLILHTFNFSNFDLSLLTSLRAVDMNTNEEINRNLVLKKVVYEDALYITYEGYCDPLDTACTLPEIREYKPTRTLKDLTPEDNGKNITLAIVGSVQDNDYYDIAYTYAGIDVYPFYATVYGDLGSGLVSYYKLDNDDLTDAMLRHNGTNTGTTNVSGKILSGRDMDTNDEIKIIETSLLRFGTSPFTINLWFSEDAAAAKSIMGKANGGAPYGWSIRYNGSAATWTGTAGSATCFGGNNLEDGNYHMITIRRNSTTATGIQLFVDGVIKSFCTGADNYNAADNLTLGIVPYQTAVDGQIDEVAIWNRSLSDAEIQTTLYNSGAGIPFGTLGPVDNPPTAELNAPSNATVYNTNSISVDFSCKGIDAVKLNNLTFYLWNATTKALITSSTNTDGENNTLETFSYTLVGNSNYTWNCKAIDNSSQSAYATANYTVVVFGIPDTAPSVEIGNNSILQNSISYTTPITANFNCSNIRDNFKVDNVSLIINSVIYNTTVNPVNNSYAYYTNNFITDGVYNWYCLATDNITQQATTATQNFTIDTTPYISFISPTLANNTSNSSTLLRLYVDITTPYFYNWTAYLYNSTSLVTTATYTNSTRNHTFLITTDGNYYYKAVVNTNTSQDNETELRLSYRDITDPFINITLPTTNATTTTALPVNVTYNISASDTNLDTCYYNLTGIVTVACNTPFNISFSSGGNKVLRFGAVDTLQRSNTTDFTHYVYYYNYTPSYYPTILEGEINYINLSIIATAINSLNATLNYNGTLYSPQISNNGTFALLSNNFSVPTVTTAENVLFSWTIYLDGIQINTTNYTQVITAMTPINISLDCNDTAANFTFKDEVNLSNLNANIRYNIVYGHSTNESIKTIYGTLNNVNSFRVCVNASLGRDYIINSGEIYYTLDGYGDRRFYFFSGSTLNGEAKNYTLPLLETSKDQSFKFDFQDTGLNKYANHIIALLRWYPDLNDYETVAMGKTDDDGYTILNPQLETVDYRAALYTLDGSLITLKNATRFSCYVEPCTYSSTVKPDETNFINYYNMESSINYNYTTKIFTLIYNDPSQETDSVRLVVTRETGTSILTLCNTSASGYTGVIACNTSTVEGLKRAVVFRTASPEKVLNEKTINDDDYSGLSNNVGLIASAALWLMIVLLGLANSPVWAIILGVVGLAPALALGSINYAVFTGVAILAAIIIHFIKRSLS